MQADRGNPKGPAVLIERRVAYVLHVEGREKPRENPSAVVGFEHIFRTVTQRAVSNQKIQSAQRQVLSMHRRESASRQLGGSHVEGPFPTSPRDGSAARSKPV